jgi:translin
MSISRARAGVQARLEAKSRARETALGRTRQAIRRSANAIRAVHRGELEVADALLAEARSLLDVAESVLAAHPDVYYAGFLQDAQKEYAEARATRALVAGEELPAPEDVGVGDAPYLNGLAETVGELRRHLLDVLRAGDLAHADELFAAMEEIHALLADVDHPDAITGGLRRSTDVARAVIERTRSDLTLTTVQRDLADALRRGGAPALEPEGQAGDPGSPGRLSGNA